MSYIQDELRHKIQEFVKMCGDEFWESSTIDVSEDFQLCSIWQVSRDEGGELVLKEVYNDIVIANYAIDFNKYDYLPTYVSFMPAPTEPYLIHQVMSNMFDSYEPVYGTLESLVLETVDG